MTYTFKIIHLFVMSLISLVVANIRPRVVGGIPDDGQEFPFAVMIQTTDPPTFRDCSGSIIAKTWVLTAGHCVPNDKDKETRRIKYGDPKTPSNETKNFAKIIKCYRHPGYKGVSFHVLNDIGLLKTEVMTNPTIGKLYAVDYKALMGLPVKYAGFGRSRFQPGLAPVLNVEEDVDPPLLVGEAVVVSCRQDRGLSSGRPAICVAPRCGPRQQPYYGDSGGPLMLSGRIIGVANGFGTLDLPVVGYGPVSPYLNWIYDKVHAD